MHFFQTKDGAKHRKRYLGLNPPFDLNVHTGTAGTGSDILNTNHMFPNSVGPFTYLLPLYVRNQSMYGFLRGLYTGVFCTRLCMDVGSREQYRNHFVVLRECTHLTRTALLCECARYQDCMIFSVIAKRNEGIKLFRSTCIKSRNI